MPDLIDYKFLSEREGGSSTKGYVPAANVSKSGVTIATGFDLGQRNEADLKKLKLLPSLEKKLTPYLGKTGKTAKDFLTKSPLTINAAQAEEIDKAVKAIHLNQLTLTYDAAIKKDKKKFSDLPAAAQTVIASVSFQYGVGLSAAAPKFWKQAVDQNWSECIKVLEHFGDAYPTRRKAEAKLLEPLITSNNDSEGKTK